MKLNPLQNIKGYRFLSALIDLLGGGFLLFRPTDDGSDTARRPRSGRGWGGGGVAVLMMAGLYEEAPPERGTFIEALGIRKGRDYTS